MQIVLGTAVMVLFVALLVAGSRFVRAQKAFFVRFNAEYPDADWVDTESRPLGTFLRHYGATQAPSEALQALHRDAIRRQFVAAGLFIGTLLLGLAFWLLQ